jgi:uncharacterized protein (DUF1800 family)
VARRRRRSPRRPRGRWTEAHVRRLFWRAGFGATPREARHWARRGKAATIKWLLHGGPAPVPRIPPPRADGKRLDRVNEWSHDALWWLDRMVRTRRPLVEKLTLFWHDHFATSDQDTPLMLAQNETLRAGALGSFPDLLRAITQDTAMQLFLSLAGSDRRKPNENYARELMELFTLGRGYDERDVREAARALTGFKAEWHDDGSVTTSYDERRHDPGQKTIFGQTAAFGWQQVLDLCVAHPAHAPFLVSKLWAFFVDAPLPESTRARLVRTYRESGRRIGPVVGQILAHPALYRNLDRPGMVKSPLVYMAGALRAARQGVDREAYGWLLSSMGQMPFRPPSVAGWDWGEDWLSTNSMHVRWDFANYLLEGRRLRVRDGSTPARLTPRQAVARARRATGDPWTSARTDRELLRMAERVLTERPLRPGKWRQPRQQRADMCQRALRHLLVCGPDAHVH